MNFLENHYQKHILSPVQHDQHPEKWPYRRLHAKTCVDLRDQINFVKNYISKDFKGTHTVYFSSSIYIINQKPTIPRTHFHCITT